MSKNILVAYFSASGITAKAAWKLSEAIGADLDGQKEQKLDGDERPVIPACDCGEAA